MILYGKPFAQRVEREVARRAAKMHAKPVLAIVLVGSDPASLSYVKRKGQAAESLGCGFLLRHLTNGVSEARVILLLKKLNKDKKVRGIIVQLPLPKKFNTERVLSAIAPQKDIDNLRGDSPFLSPSVQAIWHLLTKTGVPKKSAPILIIGYGRLIGKPLHAFLVKKGFTNIDVADKKTENLNARILAADVVISATGQPSLVKRVKRGAVVIDAGAGIQNGKIKGDVDIARVAKFAKVVAPVPGGVGPLTVAYLFKNLISA